MKLQIYRGNDTQLISFDIDENTTFSETQMAEKQITCSVILPFVLPVQLGDYIVHKGERYKINTVPEYGKSESDHSHKYNIVFESPVYSLHDKFLMHEGTDDFSYHGTAADHLRLIVDNINQIEPGWTLGTIEVTDPMNLDYNNHSCRTALTAIAEKFKLEFFLVGQQVNMVKTLGADTGLVFEFGRGKGLYELNRKIADDKNVVTRVYAFGGSKNIDYTYRDKAKKLLFQEKYLEANVDLYGIKEGKYENAEIFPSRTGMITAVIDKTTVVDTSIDFDINAHLQEGEKAKIVFKSGALANYEFEIWKYDHSKKAIYFNVFKDTNDYTLPNELNFPEVNAKYTLVNLKMPESYITAAESRLKADALAYLQENSVPRVAYGLKPDEKYIRDNGIQLRVGDRITLVDLKLPINATLRIATLTYPLVNEANIDVSISNFIPYTMQDRLVASAIDTKKEVKQVSRIQAEQARRNSINLYDLKDSVIDPTTDKYYAGKIATGSIESLYLAIGAKATNFNLSGVSFKPNYLGNPNTFTATAGELIHYDLNVPGVGFTWEMDTFTASNLVAANKYYLYAKISKSVLVGSWELSTEVKSAESVPGYYILQAGVLFPVKDGRRDNALTNGMVFIVGDQITAGRIKSIDEKMFMDLTTGQLKLGDELSGIDWNVSSPNKLTIRGGVVQNAGGIQAPIPVFRGVYNSLSTYYRGDQVTHNGSSWNVISGLPISNVSPEEGSSWTVAAVGQNGPLPTGGDEYKSDKQYTGNASKVDIVRYDDGSGEKAYVARVDAGTFSGILPTNASKWNAFGGQYESLATNLFFAKMAFITNLGVENLKTAESGKRVEITKQGNGIKFFNEGDLLYAPSVSVSAQIALNGSAVSSGLDIKTNEGISGLTGAGLFANGGKVPFLSSATGLITNASVVGFLFNRNLQDGGYSAAGAFLDGTKSDTNGASKTLAIYASGDMLVTKSDKTGTGNLTVRDGTLNADGDLKVKGNIFIDGVAGVSGTFIDDSRRRWTFHKGLLINIL
ncbi:phage tail protein [Pedobacter sp. FW305-3-2-15-E-R2A2]|uniref:phage tail protein n=1 Tax=Pedobacter sp. FW305-3-2-15-E-R2A2 TaxID=3140251 RepID=UPI00314010B2